MRRKFRRLIRLGSGELFELVLVLFLVVVLDLNWRSFDDEDDQEDEG